MRSRPANGADCGDLGGDERLQGPEVPIADAFGLKIDDRIVQILGAGSASALMPGWVAPAGLAGGLYLALARVKHTMNRDRCAKENFAMVTDFAGAAILAVGVIALLA